MKLKVCGITTVTQLKELQELPVDYAGLIFYEKSKRYAYEKLKRQEAEIQKVPIKKVGVFVNADMGFLKSCIVDFGLSAVQLHGDESPDYCASLQKEITVIKVFRIGNTILDIDSIVAPFLSTSDYFLFDTDTAGYGGSGHRFDWNLLQKAVINKPFFLSGGIGLEDLERVKTFQHPWFYGVDVNSRFETCPGIKDMGLLKTFAASLNQPLWTK